MTRVEYERRRRGWTQTELAFHARLHQGEISRIECRRIIPTHLYRERLSRALGVAEEDLLDEVDADGRLVVDAQQAREPDRSEAVAS